MVFIMRLSIYIVDADVVVVVAVIILVGLFSMQHYGTDRVGWLFAPVVLLWFLIIGGIGIYNIYNYDSSVLRAFSPLYIYRYLSKGKKKGWTSLGGIMLSITGLHIFPLSLSLVQTQTNFDFTLLQEPKPFLLILLIFQFLPYSLLLR